MRSSVVYVLPLLAACADKGESGDTSATPSAEPPTVVLNEILASNLKTNSDDLGEFDDWVELYNPGTEAASLDGVYLSDDAALPTAWAIPQGEVLPPGGHLLVWCDDATGAEGLHATFKLNAAGDEVVLSFVHGSDDPVRLDWVQFGKQVPDRSAAREPDGGETWNPDATPTPGAANAG